MVDEYDRNRCTTYITRYLYLKKIDFADLFSNCQALAENGTGFLVGDSVTIADCALFNILSYLDEMQCYDNILNDFPLCKVS